MAHKTDMAKAKAKYEEEKERAARQASFGRRTTWWRPLASKANKARICPPWTDEGPNKNQWWREVWMHYGVTSIDAPDEDNQFAVPCPRRSPDGKEMFGGGEVPDCKICQLVEELKSSGNPADAEVAKQLRAKMRIYINMIDVNDPIWTSDAIDELKANGCPEEHLPKEGGPKVQVYNFGPQIFKMLLDQYSDDIDLADLEEGHDVVIEREGEGLKTKYRVRAMIKPTKAPINDDQLDDNMWNLDTLVPYFSDEQIDLILGGGTKEEVYGLFPQSSESKQLAEKTESTEESESGEEAGNEPDAADEGQEAASSTDPAALDSSDIPVDDDGDIIFDQLTDEQIENPANAEAEVTNKEGTTYGVHVSCFGKEDEYKPEDKDCKECFLYKRCGKRVEAKKKAAEATKKAGKGAPGKKASKGAPGKGGGNNKPKAGKPKAGKSKPAESAGSAEELEQQMLAAMGKGEK